MDPKLWGRGVWYLIFSALYNDDLFDNFTCIIKFIAIICDNLPCEDCKNHIRTHLDKNNIFSTSDINTLRRFFIEVHNATASRCINN